MATRRILLAAGALAVLAAGAFLGGRGLLGSRPYEPPPYEPPPRRSQPATGPNLLLVTLDTTRADRLGCYGNDLVATPRLDAFAASGVRFDAAFCPMPETDPSHASMLTGLEPLRHGVLRNGWPLSPEHRGLAQTLREAGYTTFAAVSVKHLGRKVGFHHGFDLFDAEFDGHERTGPDTLRLVESWLDDLGTRPFFLWVHWFDAHRDRKSPPPRYHPPEALAPDEEALAAYRARGLPDEVARYDAQLRLLDDLLGRLLDGLAASGALAHTVVAVLADHGETLDEIVERFQYGYTHGEYLYEHQVRVPFLLAGPGIPKGSVVKGQVRVFDLFPTALAALGLEDRIPPGIDGVNLLPSLGRGGEDLPVFLQRDFRTKYRNVHDVALRDGGKKLILSADLGSEFYDLVADPGETRNLLAAGEVFPDADSMRARLEAWARRFESVGDRAVDGDLVEALVKIGYFEPIAETRR